ncbi:MAG: hypothetical protein QT11_C0001G0030 [archaeon GW2011_AR20]|nr:MAG: hypothetical protein QT11_C0001G0030 [archaeon GW2011_AR20]MBS3160095.1 hypothetical protein [Candidatus Woesearchaeota archaeon]
MAKIFHYIVAASSLKYQAINKREDRKISSELEKYLRSKICFIGYADYIKELPFYLIKEGGDKQFYFSLIAKRERLKKKKINEIKEGIKDRGFILKVFKLEELV